MARWRKDRSFQINRSPWVNPPHRSSLSYIHTSPCLLLLSCRGTKEISLNPLHSWRKLSSQWNVTSLLLSCTCNSQLLLRVCCEAGSPKRRQFQRQRAASESMDQDDNDAHHIDLIQYIARTHDVAYCPSQPTTRLLSPPSTPPPSLGRYL